MPRSTLQSSMAMVSLLALASPARMAAQDFSGIEAYVVRQMRDARVPGLAVAVIKDTTILFLKGYGTADGTRPVTPQTPFIIGSVSKSFTALATMQLVDAGRIALDDPVTRHIPWFRTADSLASAGITIRHLLNQTSGIPTFAGLAGVTWTDSSDDALARRVQAMRTVSLAHQPGSTYAYSNANYAILGLLIQQASGQSYEAFLREHVFGPLDMANSFASQAEAVQHGLATGHRWWFGFPVATRLPFNRADLPAGYVSSSAEDMAHYLMAQLNRGRFRGREILSPMSTLAMHARAVESRPGRWYGMGWGIGLENGIRVIDHEGGTANYQAAAVMAPEEGIGVVVLANGMALLDAFSSSSGITARRVALGVLSLATGREVPEPGGAGGIRRLYLIVDFVVLFWTAWLVGSLWRMPRWYRRLRDQGARSRGAVIGRSLMIGLLYMAWPVLLLFILPARAAFPAWQVMAFFQPDLTWWLGIVATITLVSGLVRLALLLRMER